MGGKKNNWFIGHCICHICYLRICLFFPFVWYFFKKLTEWKFDIKYWIKWFVTNIERRKHVQKNSMKNVKCAKIVYPMNEYWNWIWLTKLLLGEFASNVMKWLNTRSFHSSIISMRFNRWKYNMLVFNFFDSHPSFLVLSIKIQSGIYFCKHFIIFIKVITGNSTNLSPKNLIRNWLNFNKISLFICLFFLSVQFAHLVYAH